MLIGNIAQLLYGTVDSLVVGKYVGDAALSAVGISNNVVTLFIVFFMAIGSGIMIMVSNYEVQEHLFQKNMEHIQVLLVFLDVNYNLHN